MERRVGEVFVHWLIFQSLCRIGALCQYCMIVWAITLPILVITGDRAHTTPNPGPVVRALHDWRWSLAASWYSIVVLLVAERFWAYWSTLL